VLLNYLLFSVYLFLFTWIVLKLPFFKRSGLTRGELVLVFWSKILAGVIYGLVGIYYKITKGGIGRDTWRFHLSALQESSVLKSNPVRFFSDVENKYPHGYDGFFSSHNSWWNDMHDTLFIKFLAVLDILSFGNYYINVIFYSFIILFGAVIIFKIFMNASPGNRQMIFIGTFFIPSVLYWTSGIHKDGFIFLALALITGGVYDSIKKGLDIKKAFYILTGTMLLISLRNFLLVMLIPALLAWLIAARTKKNPLLIFSICYIFFVFVFFESGHLSSKLNFPAAVVQKQNDFLVLVGQSAVPVNKLQPDFKSFIENAWQSFNLAVLQPTFGKVRSVFILPAALEEFALLILFVASIFYRKKIKMTAFSAFCVFYSLSVLMSIGYTVNIIGAIVRYRSVVLVFLVLPLLISIDWIKAKKTYKNLLQ
jgi:hypothetical protein